MKKGFWSHAREGALVSIVSWLLGIGMVVIATHSKPQPLIGVTEVNIKTNADKSEVWVSGGGVFAVSIVSINGSLRAKSVVGTRNGVWTAYTEPNKLERTAWNMAHGG